MTDENNSRRTFNQLCSLVGKWVDSNSTTTVEFRKSANDSILIETWFWPEKKIEALTIYHLDDNELVATHYCPIGNQPHLKHVVGDKKDRLAFQFVSSMNLPDPSVDHCESFWFEINSEDQFTRSETYSENYISDTQQSTYKRLKV